MASTADEAPVEAHGTRDKDEGCGYRRPTHCFVHGIFRGAEPWETC